jgi:hypothetical protein
MPDHAAGYAAGEVLWQAAAAAAAVRAGQVPELMSITYHLQ